MVGHLQHVRREVPAPGEHPRLGLGAEVAGEQHPQPALGDPHDQAQVVGVRPGDRACGHGCQRLELHAADRPPVPRHQHDLPPAGSGDQPGDGRRPVVGRGQGAGDHLAHRAAGQRAGQPAHVVGVEVREHHQRQPVHPQPVQAAVDQGEVGPGVDQHRLAG